jgi:hypothetical protein
MESSMRHLRYRVACLFARILRVPVEVHPIFVMDGRNDFNTPKCCTTPK